MDDNKKNNDSIKLDDKTLEDIDIDLLNVDDEDNDDEEEKIKDFYDYDDSLFDFGPVGSIGNHDSDIDVHKTTRRPKNEKVNNPLKQNNNINVNLFDDEKQKNYEMFNNQKENDLKTTNQENQSNIKEEVVLENDNLQEDVNYDEIKIKSLIESALYVYGNEGLSINDLKKLTSAPSSLLKKIMRNWTNELDNDPSRGLTIKIYGDRYKFFSKSENRENLSKLITIKYRDPLTQRVVETLAIIAYNQPCTKAIIEDIRGKDPTSAIQKLIDLGLVVEAGRADHPGRPLLFEVTNKFYDIFGIKNVKDLPSINLDQPFQDDDVSFFDTTRFND